jgi:hypothetical protein
MAASDRRFDAHLSTTGSVVSPFLAVALETPFQLLPHWIAVKNPTTTHQRFCLMDETAADTISVCFKVANSAEFFAALRVRPKTLIGDCRVFGA